MEVLNRHILCYIKYIWYITSISRWFYSCAAIHGWIIRHPSNEGWGRHPEGMDSGILEGWLLLIGIPPFGWILGSSILVVPLVTSKIIGLAGEIQNKRDWSRTPTGLLALFIKRSECFPTRGTNTLGPIQTRDRELARTRPFLGHLTVVKIDFTKQAVDIKKSQ